MVWLATVLGSGACASEEASDDAAAGDSTGTDTGAGDGADGADGTDGADGADGADDGGEGGSSGGAANCDEDELSALYTRYVEPFVSGTVPQSCGQCHMTGIDMSMYAQDTPCDTMACMMGQGVVDLDNPEGSQILSMIDMGDPQSSVFDISVEHQAMLEWINWSAECNAQVCGEIESPCEQNTGTSSTGVNPIGDCSEDDLLREFWDTVIADRGRCISCHTDWGQNLGTFGPCTSVADCTGMQECQEGSCVAPGPYDAPHFFEGVDGMLEWENPEHRDQALQTMYNFVALGLVDVQEPLDSWAILKPLLEGFQPTEIHGEGVSIPSVPEGVGKGIYHGGTSKFSFGCHEPGQCAESAPVDCRVDAPCGGDAPNCGAGMACMDGYCRLANSYCDMTYVNYIRFIQYFADCKN